MKYYTSTTQFNCGIDLHAHQMYVCVMDRDGHKLVHTNIKNNDFAFFLKRIEPSRHDLTVCAECMFGWYWLADACQAAGLHFVLAHALYLKAIHGGPSSVAAIARRDSKKQPTIEFLSTDSNGVTAEGGQEQERPHRLRKNRPSAPRQSHPARPKSRPKNGCHNRLFAALAMMTNTTAKPHKMIIAVWKCPNINETPKQPMTAWKISSMKISYHPQSSRCAIL